MNLELINELNKSTLKNTKTFSFENINTYAKVLRVHDADTITIAFKFHDSIIKINIRIDNIDSPELKSKNPDEVKSAELARDFLSNLILNTIIKINLKKFDKYGRSLADIFLINTNENIADRLIKNGYVRKYNGGKKLEWKKEELFINKATI